jgi:hypothetical protein
VQSTPITQLSPPTPQAITHISSITPIRYAGRLMIWPRVVSHKDLDLWQNYAKEKTQMKGSVGMFGVWIFFLLMLQLIKKKKKKVWCLGFLAFFFFVLFCFCYFCVLFVYFLNA